MTTEILIGLTLILLVIGTFHITKNAYEKKAHSVRVKTFEGIVLNDYYSEAYRPILLKELKELKGSFSKETFNKYLIKLEG